MMKCLLEARLQECKSRWQGGDWIQNHFKGRPGEWAIYELQGPVIITLRDKQEVIASWKRRGRYLGELDPLWREMEAFIELEDDVYLLHVDDPERREDELHAISERLGIPLQVDFTIKVGHGTDSGW
jgi:hypothetical protein